MIIWLIIGVLTVSLFELLKRPETGFDLVLLGLTVVLIGWGWGIYGFQKEGMIAGVIIFVIIRFVTKLIRQTARNWAIFCR